MTNLSSQKITIICGCGRTITNLPSPAYSDIPSLELHCQHCGGTTIVTTSRGRIADQRYGVVVKYDELIDADMQTNVPEASACILEAAICINNDAKRAATVMARAALEVTLEYAGFDKEKLYEKVTDAVSAGAITDYDQKRAENVRLIGNFGAHGSSARYVPEDANMNKTDAKYTVEVASELIKKIIRWRLRRP
jgi:hypothetical protein